MMFGVLKYCYKISGGTSKKDKKGSAFDAFISSCISGCCWCVFQKVLCWTSKGR